MARSLLRSQEEIADIKDLLKSYLECAEYIVEKCQSLGHITGAQKLERKCVAELKYLKSLAKRKGGFDVSNLRSSNLSHYLGVVHAAEHLPDVTQILQAFTCPGRTEPLHVDVVAGQGHLWVKVIARKAQALHLIWAGQGQYGERDILLQAEDYVVCSESHPVSFVDPKVVFAFFNGVTSDMAAAFRKAKVVVLGNEVPVSPTVHEKLSQLNFDDSSDEDDDNDAYNKYKDSNNSVNSENSSSSPQYANKQSGEKTIQTQKNSAVISSDKQIVFPGKGTLTEQSECNVDSVHSIDSTVNQSPEICKNDKLDLIDCPEQKQSQTIEQSSISNESHQNVSNTSILSTRQSADNVICLEKQFGAQIDLLNEPINNIDPSGNNSISAMSILLPFIEKELLTFPLVDFRLLQNILASNLGNTIENIVRVNLDVTALITLVSAVSHGSYNYRFKEKILNEQAADERVNPVLPPLNAFLKGKELYACETAMSSFQTILDTLGGDDERSRAVSLLKNVKVVPDQSSFRTETMPNTGKIKDRSKVIFGTGDSLRAVTVTANSGFVRAAEHQGVLYAVFIHASRALTEQKQNTTAVKIDIDDSEVSI